MGDVELALAMFSAMIFIRSDCARIPDAATVIDVEKSMLHSFYEPVWPMAVFIMVIALA